MSGPFAPHLLALVGVGGALGSLVRYAGGILLARWLGGGFPWGTLAVNLVGSAAIGALGGAMAGGLALPEPLRLLVIVGVLGGFTTFSAFSLDVGVLWLRAPWLAAGYVAASVGGGLALFGAAFALARR